MAKNIWVAYIGNQPKKDEKDKTALTEEDIRKALDLESLGYFNDGGMVRIEQLGKAIFGQTVAFTPNNAEKELDPVVSENSENQSYIYITSYRDYFTESYNRAFYEYEDDEYGNSKKAGRLTWAEKQEFGDLANLKGPHEIYNNAFQKYGAAGLSKLLRHGSFNYVNYNKDTDTYFACVGRKKTGNKGYNPQIYYAFLNDEKDNIVLSNTRELIITLADKIYHLPENSYVMNGFIEKLKPEPEIIDQEIEEENNNLSKAMSDVIRQTTFKQMQRYQDQFVDSLEKITEDYIKQFDVNRLLTKKQRDTLISDVKHAVLTSVRDDLQASEMVHTAVLDFEQQIKDTCKQRIDEFMETIYIPQVYIITDKDKTRREVPGVFHEQFPEVLSSIQLNEPIMLVGPAGSGKNVAVSQAADVLGLPMYYTVKASNEFKLLGYMDAGGVYHETPYYKAFTEGGIFLLDEIDTSDPAALTVANSGLSNGYMEFPNSPKPVEMHPNFRMVAGANTWGKGADLQYVGRNPLDASTLDRFDMLFLDYDEKMESILYPDDEVLEFMWNFRRAVFDTKTPHIVSTRGINKVYTKKVNGISIDSAVSKNIVKGLSKDQLSILIGKMEEMNTIPEENQYYQKVKRLIYKPTPEVPEKKQNQQGDNLDRDRIVMGVEEEYDGNLEVIDEALPFN